MHLKVGTKNILGLIPTNTGPILNGDTVTILTEKGTYNGVLSRIQQRILPLLKKNICLITSSKIWRTW
jgi:hypothetical protein